MVALGLGTSENNKEEEEMLNKAVIFVFLALACLADACKLSEYHYMPDMVPAAEVMYEDLTTETKPDVLVVPELLDSGIKYADSTTEAKPDMPVMSELLDSGIKYEDSRSEETTTTLPEEDPNLLIPEMGGATSFRIPLERGYNWEITQSWAEHCEYCNSMGYDNSYGDYCSSSSHLGSCCLHSWDFNLPGTADLGKATLATGDGEVKFAGTNGNWGKTVVVDHGDGVCSRYAHLDLISVSKGQRVCQGLKLGEIGGTPHFPVHLHFQFEDCDSKATLAKGFTDGNGIPKCRIGADILDGNGNYNFLILSNVKRTSCDGWHDEDDEPEVPLNEGGWRAASCGSLQSCPLVSSCGRNGGHRFEDHNRLEPLSAAAASYLYSECALDGKSGNILEPSAKVTRAEALKIALFLFDLMKECSGNESEPYSDVSSGDWYFGIIACAVHLRLLDTSMALFNPNREVTFAEAAKFLVESASRADLIEIRNPGNGHFQHISRSHWAYRYAETIYYYGGLLEQAHGVLPDQLLSRREYIVMAASLSPCFCPNVQCERGCECDQLSFSCVDPYDDRPGTGGGGGEDPLDDDDIADYESLLEPPDVEMNCSVDEDRTECQQDRILLMVRCIITNRSNYELPLKDTILSLTDSDDLRLCQVQQSHPNDGSGYMPVAEGEDLSIGGTRILCSEMPSDKSLEASFNIVIRVEGNDLWYENVAEAEISLSQAVFDNCFTPPCIPQCEGRQCGEDGCGGYCGYCEGSTTRCLEESGICCTPDCEGRNCGDDGCGRLCGVCDYGIPCENGNCAQAVTCEELGASCGWHDNGFGYSLDCGGCQYGYDCIEGRCQLDPCVLCPVGRPCVDGQCWVGEFQCDPTHPYILLVSAPNGRGEILRVGETSVMNWNFGEEEVRLSFNCSEMPVIVRLHAGGSGLYARFEEVYDPRLYMAFWHDYEGPLSLPLPMNPFFVLAAVNLNHSHTDASVTLLFPPDNAALLE